MMSPDVLIFEYFYQSVLGRLVNRIVKHNLEDFWPNCASETVVGLGYTLPYLRLFVRDAARVVSAMPQRQGAVAWPALGRSKTMLVDPHKLPFADESLDRLLVMHHLEYQDRPQDTLREAWRVLRSEGRLLLCVPNRSSLWAFMDRTPFAMGAPMTPRQLSECAMQAFFMPVQARTVLFTPPVPWRKVRLYSNMFERMGQRWSNSLGGLILLDCMKKNFCPLTSASSSSRSLRLSPVKAPLSSGTERVRLLEEDGPHQPPRR